MLTLTGNGRLTRDVELRSTPSGKSVATVSVASDRRDRTNSPALTTLPSPRPRRSPTDAILEMILDMSRSERVAGAGCSAASRTTKPA
jgi:Single-strand binding protein family